MKKKPKPTLWIFAYYWYNPVVWIVFILGFVVVGFRGFFIGMKEWFVEVRELYKNYTLK